MVPRCTEEDKVVMRSWDETQLLLLLTVHSQTQPIHWSLRGPFRGPEYGLEVGKDHKGLESWDKAAAELVTVNFPGRESEGLCL